MNQSGNVFIDGTKIRFCDGFGSNLSKKDRDEKII